MLTIDGADGGGQLLRTALSLSVVTDTAFRIENVRGGRPEPGLGPQHLAAVEAVGTYADATVEGAEVGAETVTFEPGEARQHTLSVDIGTAGSITLLFDTFLPIGVAASDPVAVTATGGTDVKWSPPLAYLQRVKLPLLARFGLAASVDCERTGFYPTGGGQATVQTEPASLSPIRVTDRGDLERVDIYSKAADSLEDSDVAARQADHAQALLDEAGVPSEHREVAYVPTDSPGSSLLLRAVYDGTLAGFDELGERGRPSEEVAALAFDQFQSFHAGTPPVDEHMADQLLVWLALAGGRVRIPAVTEHVETNLDVIRAFGIEMTLSETAEGPVVTADAGTLG